MKTIDILGKNRFDTYTRIREGSRGIVTREEQILLSWEKVNDLWMIPGGGMEMGESPEMCCAREVLEETGYIVGNLKPFLTISEYYEEYRYITHYFLCDAVCRGTPKLTEQEKKRGLEPRWIPVEEALSIFANHAAYTDVYEEKRGIYLREYRALKAWLEIKKV